MYTEKCVYVEVHNTNSPFAQLAMRSGNTLWHTLHVVNNKYKTIHLDSSSTAAFSQAPTYTEKASFAQ